MYGPRGNLQLILNNIHLHNLRESSSSTQKMNTSDDCVCNSCVNSNVTMKKTAIHNYTNVVDAQDDSNQEDSCTLSYTSNTSKKRRRGISNDLESSSWSMMSPFLTKRVKWSFLLLAILVVIPHSNGEPPVSNNNNWDRPTGMPKITQLEVMCGAQHMEVHLTFDAPFHGLVASKGMYGHEGCVYVPPRTGQANFVFNIYYDKCGTKPDNHGKFYENTVVVQYDEELIEAWDEAKRLRCEWFNDYEKTATKTSPMVISDLDIVELNFHGDNVDCWMEIQEGKGPWAPPLNGIVPLGSPLTMVVAVKDPTGEFDMRVKACEASDGHGGHVLPLSDPEGCIVRPKLLGRFSKVKLDDGRATVLTYAYISAFKFPDMLNVHLRCTVEICRHGCPDHCASKYGLQATSNKPFEGNQIQGQHTLLEPMAFESQNVQQVVPSNNLNDLAYEEKPKPQSQEDLQLNQHQPQPQHHLKAPLNSEEVLGRPHQDQSPILQQVEPIDMLPPPPPSPLQQQQQQQHIDQQQQQQLQGFPIHQNPHFPPHSNKNNKRPFLRPPGPPQFSSPQQQILPQHRPGQGGPPQRPQGFPRPHPSHGHRLPQQGQQQQFPPRPFLKQGGPPPMHHPGQRFPPPPPGRMPDGRPNHFGVNSFEIIPSHSSEVREDQVNPRNNNEQGSSSSSPRPEEIQHKLGEGEQEEDREALMTAESNNQPLKEDRQGDQEMVNQNSDEPDDSLISLSSFPKGPRNLRVRRSVDSSSDIIGVQGTFKVISQADLDFVLNSTSSNDFSTSSSPVLRGRMSRPEEAIYGICLPKVGFGVVFFGLGLATLVAIVIAAFLAYARYRSIMNNKHQCPTAVIDNSQRCHPISQISFHEQSFPMVILRKMW